MIDRTSSQTIGKENIDASPFESIKAVIEFLDIHLQDFPSDFTKRTSKPNEIEELFSIDLNSINKGEVLIEKEK